MRRVFMILIRNGRGRLMCAVAGSSEGRVILMRGFSGSVRGRRWRWTRSSGCCWRSRGKRRGTAPGGGGGGGGGVSGGAPRAGGGGGLPAEVEGHLPTGTAMSVLS